MWFSIMKLFIKQDILKGPKLYLSTSFNILCETRAPNVLCSYPLTNIRVLERPSYFMEKSVAQANGKEVW